MEDPEQFNRDTQPLVLDQAARAPIPSARSGRRRARPALERVAVRLSHDKIHAQDREDCETKEGKLDEITRIVELSGALDDSQRQRLLEIADKCPVHRTLTSEIKIRTRLAE
jgi:uncharacterized OsmC-like protein